MNGDPLASLPWKSKNPLTVVERGEMLIRSTHGHWMRYVVAVALYAIVLTLSLALFFVALSLRTSSTDLSGLLFLIASITSAVSMHALFHRALSEHATDLLLTSKRLLFLKRSLWLSDAMEEFVIARLKVVEVRKSGIIPRLLNYGDLWVDAGGGHTIAYVPHPERWVEDIERNMRIV